MFQSLSRDGAARQRSSAHCKDSDAISRHFTTIWPSRSPDLSPYDFWLVGGPWCRKVRNEEEWSNPATILSLILPVQGTSGPRVMDNGKALQTAKTKKGERVRKLRENPFHTKTGKITTEGALEIVCSRGITIGSAYGAEEVKGPA
ncbi:hypothetical protein TNCV_5059101 [Trichonephila clavipes]|nr:hypothetical protein TNCV_5059101 [Trichonephila clavipes]